MRKQTAFLYGSISIGTACIWVASTVEPALIGHLLRTLPNTLPAGAPMVGVGAGGAALAAGSAYAAKKLGFTPSTVLKLLDWQQIRPRLSPPSNEDDGTLPHNDGAGALPPLRTAESSQPDPHPVDVMIRCRGWSFREQWWQWGWNGQSFPDAFVVLNDPLGTLQTIAEIGGRCQPTEILLAVDYVQQLHHHEVTLGVVRMTTAPSDLDLHSMQRLVPLVTVQPCDGTYAVLVVLGTPASGITRTTPDEEDTDLLGDLVTMSTLELPAQTEPLPLVPDTVPVHDACATASAPSLNTDSIGGADTLPVEQEPIPHAWSSTVDSHPPADAPVPDSPPVTPPDQEGFDDLTKRTEHGPTIDIPHGNPPPIEDHDPVVAAPPPTTPAYVAAVQRYLTPESPPPGVADSPRSVLPTGVEIKSDNAPEHVLPALAQFATSLPEWPATEPFPLLSYGVDAQGNILRYPFIHFNIVGQTGGGKTSIVLHLLRQLLQARQMETAMQIIVSFISTKFMRVNTYGVDIGRLIDYCHNMQFVHAPYGIEHNGKGALHVLRVTRNVLDERLGLAEQGVPAASFVPSVVISDEWRAIMARVQRLTDFKEVNGKDREVSVWPECLESVEFQLIQGRDIRMMFGLCTQDAQIQNNGINTGTWKNFGIYYIHTSTDNQTLQNILGSDMMSRWQAIKRDHTGWVFYAGDVFCPVYIPWVTNELIDHWIKDIQPIPHPTMSSPSTTKQMAPLALPQEPLSLMDWPEQVRPMVEKCRHILPVLRKACQAINPTYQLPMRGRSGEQRRAILRDPKFVQLLAMVRTKNPGISGNILSAVIWGQTGGQAAQDLNNAVNPLLKRLGG